jgi:hypothetical protein
MVENTTTIHTTTMMGITQVLDAPTPVLHVLHDRPLDTR